MAVIDNILEFGDLNLASGNSTLASGLIGDVIDLGAAGEKGDFGGTRVAMPESPGEGQQLYLNVSVNTVVGGADGWVKLCHAAALSAGNLSTPIVSVEIPLANTLAVGQKRTVTVPMGGLARYLQISAGATATTGRVDAWLSSAPNDSEVGLK